ncbi:phosphatidylglycerophosphatase C [Leminorella grimontii]|uniref:Phosphatidylglycerophosphatase C n=1 Tax=Leminorella grimontii TaxID=82981 RepID=A0AAV5MZ97_9GAMM|nr:phosphatidylglycerophosphatase C [Leminorella grimontii]KFC97454.1 putative phosphoserine phosphatase [Leminorella grimontii ATCC 33999 = DSM 5078]GKX55185.1 phosphatidylglycerophosphatase C [Leminorella grimontii]GKX58610.1 phosphatidylglycerophosphatase C [Leminorella grimontii]VFS56790.1 HAD hydrolase, family IF [Leminorella grimontii]
MSDGNAKPRHVFFDLDGTLHQQDLFGSFIRYLVRSLPANLLLLVPLLPIVGLGLLVNGRSAGWPVSLMLWAMTAGHAQGKLNWLMERFVTDIKSQLIPFPQVLERLAEYLDDENTTVWLVTGSPQPLVEAVYEDAFFLPRVNLVASQIVYRCGGWTISMRCLGREKVKQLEQRLGKPLALYSGYSDSEQDDPVMLHCLHRWRIDPQGNMKALTDDDISGAKRSGRP